MKPKIALIVAAVLLSALFSALWFWTQYWRPAALSQRPMLPVAFEHADHKATQCASCHHNFIDGSGGGTCYGCHKHSEDIAAQIEPMFHQFCRDCHIEQQLEGEKAGPVRQCSRCHVPP